MNFHVSFEIAQLIEVLVAFGAIERFPIGVNANVRIQIARIGEASIAYLTRVRPFSRVDSSVNLQITFSCESFATIVTFMWSFARMVSSVASQIARQCERFATIAAFERTFARMQSNVIHQTAFVHELLVAQMTFVFSVRFQPFCGRWKWRTVPIDFFNHNYWFINAGDVLMGYQRLIFGERIVVNRSTFIRVQARWTNFQFRFACHCSPTDYPRRRFSNESSQLNSLGQEVSIL